jgi:hypothetical protein
MPALRRKYQLSLDGLQKDLDTFVDSVQCQADEE